MGILKTRRTKITHCKSILNIHLIFIRSLEYSKASQNLPETWLSATYRGLKHC